MVGVERGPHRVDVPARAVAPPAPLHARGRLGREVVLLLGARVVVQALRRVHLPPRQLAGPQRGVRDDVVLLLARVPREHLGRCKGDVSEI